MDVPALVKGIGRTCTRGVRMVMAASGGLLAANRKNLLTAARLLGALVLAGLADHALRSKLPPLDRAIFLVGAAGLFLWAMIKLEGLETPLFALAREGTSLQEEDALTSRQWLSMGLGLVLATLSWPAFSQNRLRPIGLLLLGGGIATVALSVSWPVKRVPGPHRMASDALRVSLSSPRHDLLDPPLRRLILLGIVLLGAFFRLYHLDTLPADMFNDMAHIYQETEQVLRGEWMIYGTIFPGREPLLFYLNALVARASGLSFLSLKLTTALLGIVTLPVVYLLGREAYSDVVGLFAALFLSVAKWHVLISRVGFRGILTPLTTVLVVYFLLRGLRHRRRGDLLWAGAWAGLGLYTYTAALAVIPAVVLGLGLCALSGHGRDLWRMRRSLLLAALVAVLVALPLLRFMLFDGRELFWSRPMTRVSEQESSIQGPVSKVLLENLARTAGMFHVQGDEVFRTNVPYDPHLGVVTGSLFLLGFFLVLARWRRGGNALVLSFFLVMLLPTALALAFPREVPGAVRAGGAMATVMIFPAVAVVAAWRWLGRIVPVLRTSWAWGGLLAGLALWSGLYNAQLCFVAYPQTLPAANYPLYRRIAQVIDEYGDDGPVYLKSIPHWDDKDAIRLQTAFHKDWGLGGEIITEIDAAFFERLTAQQGAIILNGERDPEALQLLQQMFPYGITLIYRDAQGESQFAVFLFSSEPTEWVRRAALGERAWLEGGGP